jgi:hypothetical protein
MSEANNNQDSIIKKSYTNTIGFKMTSNIGKKMDQKKTTTKRLTYLNFGTKSNALQNESKNQEEGQITKVSPSPIQQPSPTPFHRKKQENNLDVPPPETIGQYYEQRKKIIFGNLIDNENYINKLLFKTQTYMNKQYQATSNSRRNTFFNVDNKAIYNTMIDFKEAISNYCLIIHLYLNKGFYKRAFELFLLMYIKNEVIINYFYKKIKDELPRISSSNRIGKFFPNLTKMFMQLLSCLIKLSGKFSKSKLQNFFIKHYLATIHVVSDTVIKKFGGQNNNTNEIDNETRHIGKYFYSNCLFDAAIFFFIKYQPLFISTFILQHILDLYHDKSFCELIDVEQVLLLKVNYNMGLFLYSDGNNIEAINNLNQAKNRLSDIKFLPLTKEKKEKPIQSILQTAISTEQMPILSKLTYSQKTFSNFLNSEKLRQSSKNFFMNKKKTKTNEGLKSLTSNKDLNDSFYGLNNNKNNFNNNLRISLNRKYPNSVNKKQSMPINDVEAIRESLLPRKSSGVLFGSQIMTLQQQCENVEEKIYNEIELIMSEIEISQKNYREALRHLKKLLPTNEQLTVPPFLLRNRLNLRNKYLEEKNKVFEKDRITDTNFCNYYILSDSDKRRLMALLYKIDQAFDDNYDLYSDNETSQKSVNEYQIRNYNLERKKLINSREMEKFFLFICNLSLYQLKILNESQPKPSDKRNDLPIIFNNQFKDCLTNTQRMQLCLLQSMSLSRYIILKNTDEDICPENLDYNFMRFRIKDTDTDKDKGKEKLNNNIYNLKFKKSRNVNSNNNKDFNFNNYGFNNTVSTHIKTKYDIDEENTIPDYDALLNSIKDDENRDFINNYRNSIIHLLSDLNRQEQKVFLNSRKMLKKLINKMKKGIIQKEKKEGKIGKEKHKNRFNDKESNYS